MSGTSSQRRRSGMWDSADLLPKEKEVKKHRWPGRDKSKKEPSAYDEWVMQDKQKSLEQPPMPQQQPSTFSAEQYRPHSQSQQQRPPSSDQRPGPPSRNQSHHALAGSTIRTVTPEFDFLPNAAHNEVTTISRPFTPHNAATASPKTTSSPRGSSRTRRLFKERDRDRDERSAQISPPSSRNGISSSGKDSSGSDTRTSILSRRKSSGQTRSRGMTESHDIEPVPTPSSASTMTPTSTNRPRTKTMEERRREPSPGTSLLSRSRKRIGSVHTASSTAPQNGSGYPMTMPTSSRTGSEPSIEPTNVLANEPEMRSVSPFSYSQADVLSTLPVAMQRRIGHLVKTLNGRMSGLVEFRRDARAPWTPSYCYIQHTDTGRLLFESGTGGAHQTLISHMRGAVTMYNMDSDVLFIDIRSTQTNEQVQIRLASQQDFDAWYAALLHWQNLEPPRAMTSPKAAVPDQRPASNLEQAPTSPTADTVHHQRRSSATNNRSRAGSNRSDRRRSLAAVMPRENPVIKIGKMIYWETSVGYTNNSLPALNQSSSSRQANPVLPAAGARRWKRISGQLRENGELKLHADVDNVLISVVQLSQLSRCAIQQLDPSVLESDHCIAIYPQYTSSYTSNPPASVRPIFLSLESRVLYEVWFVLLRAFTMPSIYGPRIDAEPGLESAGSDLNRDLENMIATSTSYAFRMERSLNIKIIEAKFLANAGLDGITSNGSNTHSKGSSYASPEKHGFYAEVLLDGETRGKTVVKYDPVRPVWVESFEFEDLPAVLGSVSVIIRRRPPEQVLAREREVRQMPETHNEQQGVVTSLGFDSNCGKVEIHLDELDVDRFTDRWWPATNLHGQKIGEVLINARAQEGIVLMARDYRPLGELLHRFENSLTLHMAEMVPGEVKRLSDCLLDIFQVSGKATEWIMALIEEEIDGIHKEPTNRHRYNKRSNSDAGSEALSSSVGASERELMVRDLNKTATLEANLLFRGNTLLTRALDTHMRRVGKEWLEEALTETLFNIVVKDMDCEVDPARASEHDVPRNWRRLLLFTQDVWKGIYAASNKCPVELRLVFRHIRTCAEDRYGDFLRTVQYSSVSGFLFLRFFCPAVLNPHLFGLLKGK